MCSQLRVWSVTLIVGMAFFHASVKAQGPLNSPPSIALTNPPAGFFFQFPSIIRLKASAADSDGTIVEVRFYEGTNLLGTVTQPPYNLFLTNVLLDRYSFYVLTASTIDDQGAISTSAPVQIIVGQDVARPTVSLTHPVDGEVFLLPASITVTAVVNNRDGSENPVCFFSGTNLIGTVDAPPYTLVVSNLPAGEHRLTANYADLLHNRGTSPEIRITVTPLALRSPAFSSEGRFRFTITGLSTGQNFVVQAATDLLVWTSLATNFASSNTMEFIDNTDTNSNARFYRARQNLQ